MHVDCDECYKEDLQDTIRTYKKSESEHVQEEESSVTGRPKYPWRKQGRNVFL